MHACIHAYIHTYIHTDRHTDIHTYIYILHILFHDISQLISPRLVNLLRESLPVAAPGCSFGGSVVQGALPLQLPSDLVVTTPALELLVKIW